MTELLPCPFCGGADIFIEPDEVGSGGQHVAPYHVGCSFCKCEQCEDEEQAAIAAWNRRAALQVPADHVLVSIEPTGDMLRAVNVTGCQAAEAYRTMLSVAPSAVLQEPVGKVVAAVNSENGPAMIQWTGSYSPRVGDLIFAQSPSSRERDADPGAINQGGVVNAVRGVLRYLVVLEC